MAEGPFQNAIQSLKEAAVDFSQLNVSTYVGTIKVEFAANGKVDWGALMKKAITDGKIKLAASTTLHIDGDADNFEDQEVITAGLRDAHNNAIKSGQEARRGILELIRKQLEAAIK
jgi:hypothetical protein